MSTSFNRRDVLKFAGATTVISILPTRVFGQAQAGLTLNVGTPDLSVQQFDPMILTQTGTALVSCVYDNPFEMTDEGAVAPGIVDKWDIAPDGLSWTFHLRDDVLWQDGTKLTADDIAYSYVRSVGQDNYQGAVWRDVLGKEPKVEVIDPLTVKIYTNGPQPNLAVFSTAQLPCQWVVCKAYIEKNGEDYFAKNPMGTGQYKVVNVVPGDRMEFEAVPTSWHGKAGFDKVNLLQVPEETTRIGMLGKNQLDITPVSLQNSIELLKQGYNIQKGASGQVQMQFIGTYQPEAQSSPLHDIRVRQALSLAINREEIQNVLLGGLGVWPSLLRLGWENADLTPKLRDKWLAWSKINYRYDPDAATKLINDAGYGNGVEFQLWLPPDSSAPYLQDVTTACVNYWAQLNINAQLSIVDAAAWTDNKIVRKSRKLIGYAVANASNQANPSTVKTLNYFTSVGSADLLYGSPDEPKMDALYKEGLSTMDPNRLEEILDQMIQISADSWTGFGVASGPTTYAFGSRVQGTIPPSAKGVSHFLGSMTYTGK